MNSHRANAQPQYYRLMLSPLPSIVCLVRNNLNGSPVTQRLVQSSQYCVTDKVDMQPSEKFNINRFSFRFQRCAKYDDRTACHAAFLEFSYSVWNLTRTGIFIMMCWTVNRPSWKPPKQDLGMIMERCLTLNKKAYSQLLLCAAALPLLMNGHCLSQTVHNIMCTANLLLFLVTLNGYHSRTLLMLYHVLCTIAMNAQSMLVAVYNMYRNLQTQQNDYINTLLYIMELYLMLLVLADSSARVLNKVKNPELDIMSQNRWPNRFRSLVYLLIQLYKLSTIIYLTMVVTQR